MRGKITARQREILEFIYNSFKTNGYSPTLEEFNVKFGFKSNQAIIDHLSALESKNLIKKEENSARSIVIKPLGYESINKEPLVRIAGVTAAGPTIEAIEQHEWTEMPSGYRMYEDVFVVEVYGNSMIEVGIYDRDKVLIKKEKEIYKSLACNVFRPFNFALFIPSARISSTFLSRAVSTSSATLEIEFSLSRSFTTFLMFDFIINPISYLLQPRLFCNLFN